MPADGSAAALWVHPAADDQLESPESAKGAGEDVVDGEIGAGGEVDAARRAIEEADKPEGLRIFGGPRAGGGTVEIFAG